MADYEIYDWDSEIKNDSDEFVLLEPGVYPFEVLKLDKERYEGGNKAPACPKAKVTMRVYGNDDEHVVVSDSFLLYSGMEWKISAFFRAIGYKQHGQKVSMKWDGEWLKGKKGLCRIENVEGYKDKDKLYNSIASYIDPKGDDTESDDGDDW